MTKLFSVFLIVSFGLIFGKTVDPEKKQLFQKANYEIILHPDKSLEVLDYIEKNFSLDNDEKEKLDYLKIKSFFLQNDLTQVFKKISINDEDLTTSILILKRSILYSLNINAEKNITEAKKNNDFIFSAEIMQLLNDFNQNKVKNPASRLFYILKKAKSSNPIIARENLLYLSNFLAKNDVDFSSESFLKGLMDLYKNDPEFSIVYAKYLILHNDSENAGKIIYHLPKEALEQSTNPNLRYNYYDLLVNFYSKTGEYDNYKEAIDKKEMLFKSIDLVKFSAKNKWFNIVEENSQNDQKSLLINKKNILFLIIAFGSMMTILITIRLFQFNFQIKEYQNFISKINILKEKKSPQPQVISEKTENILLKKLNDFEKTEDFIKSDISLQSLAKKLETNTKYLSETINNHKQKNFNAYINELRINYIIDKLKKKSIYRSYKIKYLAEESGFSTHSAFAAVFKSVTGMSPINYIQLLKQKEE